MTEVRVLIVEDEVLIAMDIEDYLETQDYKIAGTARNSTMAIDMLESRQPDLVLLDITIEGDKSGIDIAKIIREKYKLPFIYITSHADKITLDSAKKTLPYGYIVKPFNESDLLSTIEMALYRHANESNHDFPSLKELNKKTALTEKEYICLKQLCDGLTNRQMAEQQFVSINTVKTHLKNLFLKMDVQNRTSLIAKMREFNS